MESLRIALAKGRLYEESEELLTEAVGSTPHFSSRKLLMKDETQKIEYVLVRAHDVPTYVQAGICDLGIVGKDVLLEEESDVYELLDLKFGACQFILAARADSEGVFPRASVSVATKFPNVARRFFKEKGISADIIRVRGNTELAPLVGLAELIVDIVSTGRTLKDNGLVVLEEIGELLSARLIANPGSFRFKGERIRSLVRRLSAVVAAKEVTG